MFSSVVSEGEFNVVIPQISAFSFIQDRVGDAVSALGADVDERWRSFLFSHDCCSCWQQHQQCSLSSV